MRPFAIFTVLSVLFLSVLVTPSPLDQQLDKRDSGELTWFYDGLGACGYYNVDSDLVVAISYLIYDSGANCGRWIGITNTANGETAYGMVRDKCMGCNAGHLDVSVAVFEALGLLATGVLSITWEYMPAGFTPP